MRMYELNHSLDVQVFDLLKSPESSGAEADGYKFEVEG
jgi:hypothetical protein